MPETVPLSTEPLALPSPSKRVKTKTGSSKTAKKPDGTLSEKILKVVGLSKERKGLSRVALKKAMAADGYDVHRKAVRINTAVKRLIASGKLVQTKGTGAAGSFKLNKDESAQVKKSTKVKSTRVKSTKVKSTKVKSARVKSISARKVAKTPTKAKAAKKTTKKPVVKRTVRKISPKKAQKSPATSSKQSRKTSVKVKKSVKKGMTKASKPKSKPATKGLKKKKVTLKKK